METLKFKRILLKLSGEALSGGAQDPIMADALAATAAQIKSIAELGVQVGIVVGGGNIWRARSAGAMERNRADHMGMLATAINGLALCDALSKQGVSARVFSAVEMQRFCDTFSAREANASLDKGEVAIFVCGSGSPFFTTDTAAALRACEIHAEALLLAKNVDAMYDKNPDVYADAKRLTHPTYDELISLNVGGMDQTAITLCKEQKIHIAVFPLKGKDSIRDAVYGKNIGTLVDC
ncbi:MAG: UMP kinase [Clostridia bacterium]|nr:UMP kinase [Clostridia bacterium]